MMEFKDYIIVHGEDGSAIVFDHVGWGRARHHAEVRSARVEEEGCIRVLLNMDGMEFDGRIIVGQEVWMRIKSKKKVLVVFRPSESFMRVEHG